MVRTPRHKTNQSLGDIIIARGPAVLLIWATIVFVVAMFRGQSSISRYLSLKDSEIVLSKAVNDIETENLRLENEIRMLKSSKIYARKVLRDKYHVTESDEKIVYFAD